jgi:hypothetical protein
LLVFVAPSAAARRQTPRATASTAVLAEPSGGHLIGADANALDLADAMQSSDQPGLVVGASWPILDGEAANPSSSSAVGIGSQLAGSFMPDDGPSFAALTTGDVAIADPPNDNSGAGVENGTSTRNVNDPSILKVDVNVPSGDNCLAVDGVFYSEEYPEYVGSAYNDAFLAELDHSSWTYDPETNHVTAPDNFAFDQSHNQLTVNSVSFTAEGSTGLQYDGSTRLLTMSTPITPGEHSLYFSIYDAGDHIFDSAMFLDHLRTLNTTAEACGAGAKLADTDGDGIPDTWETEGIRDHNGNMLLDLPAMGADPNHKDIFVQADAITGLKLSDSALRLVEKAFQDAPVSNPDGSTGVHLHVDNGPGSIMNLESGQIWGALSRARSDIPFQAVLGGNDSHGNYLWSEFEHIKATHLDPNREAVFHYVISANRQASGSTSSGISRGIPSSDFLVTLGSWCQPEGSCAGSLLDQAGTLMHELGHNLGLHHGGQVDANHVPNYLSVMNYTFQTTGLATAPDIVDYSRYDSSTIPPLDESELYEPAGFASNPLIPAAGEETLIRCPGGLFTSPYWSVEPMSGPVDFNCNGDEFETNVGDDLNGDGNRGTLTSYDDWHSLLFKGGAIGGQALGALLPEATEADEPPRSELEEVANALVPPPIVTTGAATSVGATTATLTDEANPNGREGRTYFQYGPSTGYGSLTSATGVGAGALAVPAVAAIGGLAPGTTYHYQAVVETDAHLAYGTDRTFTTTGSATSATAGFISVGHPPGAHLSSAFTLVRVSAGRHGAITLVVRTSSTGKLTSRATYRRRANGRSATAKHRPARLVYGSGSRTGGPGLIVLTVKPTTRSLRLLKLTRHLAVDVVLTFVANGTEQAASLGKKLVVRFGSGRTPHRR